MAATEVFSFGIEERSPSWHKHGYPQAAVAWQDRRGGVTAKCWMHGIPAHNTAGLRANFAGSDLLIDTDDPGRQLLVPIKIGYSPEEAWVYMTQCSGKDELERRKFSADFVVFVNLDRHAAMKHQHDGTLDFHNLTYYVVPRAEANALYRDALRREHDRPLIKTGGQRKLGNLAVNIAAGDMASFKDAWHLIKDASVAPQEIPSK